MAFMNSFQRLDLEFIFHALSRMDICLISRKFNLKTEKLIDQRHIVWQLKFLKLPDGVECHRAN